MYVGRPWRTATGLFAHAHAARMRRSWCRTWSSSWLISTRHAQTRYVFCITSMQNKAYIGLHDHRLCDRSVHQPHAFTVHTLYTICSFFIPKGAIASPVPCVVTCFTSPAQRPPLLDRLIIRFVRSSRMQSRRMTRPPSRAFGTS